MFFIKSVACARVSECCVTCGHWAGERGGGVALCHPVGDLVLSDVPFSNLQLNPFAVRVVVERRYGRAIGRLSRPQGSRLLSDGLL